MLKNSDVKLLKRKRLRSSARILKSRVIRKRESPRKSVGNRKSKRGKSVRQMKQNLHASSQRLRRRQKRGKRLRRRRTA